MFLCLWSFVKLRKFSGYLSQLTQTLGFVKISYHQGGTNVTTPKKKSQVKGARTRPGSKPFSRQDYRNLMESARTLHEQWDAQKPKGDPAVISQVLAFRHTV